MSTISQNLVRLGAPQLPSRTPSGDSQGPSDQVSLGQAPAPLPLIPDLREKAAGPSGAKLAFAGTALLLTAGGLMGCATTTAVQAPKPVDLVLPSQQPQEQVNPQVDRHAAPISDAQWQQMQFLAQAQPSDSDSAKAAKESYGQIGEQLLSEADRFKADADNLELASRKLEHVGMELGNGTHTSAALGEITVELRPDGISVTQHQGEATRTIVREHEDHVTFTDNEGHGAMTLEDTEDARTVKDGQTTRTLYLKESLLHPAGEFEVSVHNRSMMEDTRVSGPRILHESEQSVNGYVGRMRINQSEKWDVPHSGDEGLLNYSNYRTTFDFTTQLTNTTFREVEVNQDGESVVKSNNTPDGSETTVNEPARVVDPQ